MTRKPYDHNLKVDEKGTYIDRNLGRIDVNADMYMMGLLEHIGDSVMLELQEGYRLIDSKKAPLSDEQRKDLRKRVEGLENQVRSVFGLPVRTMPDGAPCDNQQIVAGEPRYVR
jgi:hypothetical protein